MPDDKEIQYKIMERADDDEDYRHKESIKKMPPCVPIPDHVHDKAKKLTEYSKTLKNAKR